MLQLFSVRRLDLVGRGLCSESPVELTEGEKKITGILKEKFPSATHVKVEDISGKYEIFVYFKTVIIVEYHCRCEI